jgi:WD40 repeat protein
MQPAALGFSPDGRLLAAWDRSRQLLIIDTTSGRTRALDSKGYEFTFCVPGIGFTADSRGVIAFDSEMLNRSTTNVVRVHDVKTGKVRPEFPNKGFVAMDMAPNGLVALAEWPGGKIVRWNTSSGKRMPAPGRPARYAQQLAVSADGNWVAESWNNTIRVWNLADTKPLKRAKRQLRSAGIVRAMALSANGEYVAGISRVLRVWDVRTGKTVLDAKTAQSYPGHEIAFHPSRPVVAYSGGTEEVAFYDAAARREVNRFAWGVGTIEAVAFSQDGLRCAAAGEGKVVVWDVDV